MRSGTVRKARRTLAIFRLNQISHLIMFFSAVAKKTSSKRSISNFNIDSNDYLIIDYFSRELTLSFLELLILLKNY